MTGGFGADYTFEATGNVAVMAQAVAAARMGWGLCTIAGVAGKGETLDIVPRLLITGRRVCGSSFGGVKGRDQVPQLVDRYLAGDIDVDPFISHHLTLDEVNRGFELMEAQDGIRSVIALLSRSRPILVLMPQVICVTGMHRAGTSVTSKLLNVLGVYLGPEHELLGPRGDQQPEGVLREPPLGALQRGAPAVGGRHLEAPAVAAARMGVRPGARPRARAGPRDDRDDVRPCPPVGVEGPAHLADAALLAGPHPGNAVRRVRAKPPRRGGVARATQPAAAQRGLPGVVALPRRGDHPHRRPAADVHALRGLLRGLARRRSSGWPGSSGTRSARASPRWPASRRTGSTVPSGTTARGRSTRSRTPGCRPRSSRSTWPSCAALPAAATSCSTRSRARSTRSGAGTPGRWSCAHRSGLRSRSSGRRKRLLQRPKRASRK